MAIAIPSFLRNPIFEREFVAFCRTKRWFILRSGIVALLVVALWTFLGINADDFKPGRLDALGSTLFAASAFTLVLFVFFATPGMVADLVVTERRKDTLEILLATPLRPAGILLGKLFSRLALLLTIVAACFPVISVTLLFGGVRGGQVLGLLAVTVGTMLFTAGPALLISTCSRRMGTAAVLSYVLPIVFLIVHPIVATSLLGIDEDPWLLLMSSTHVLMATFFVAFEDVGRSLPSGMAPVPSHIYYLGFGASVCAVCVFFAIVKLGRERRGRGFFSPAVSRSDTAERDLAALEAQVSQLRTWTEDPAELRKLASISKEVGRCLEKVRTPESGGSRHKGLGAQRVSVTEAVRDLEAVIESRGVAHESKLLEMAARIRRGRRRLRFRGMRNPVLWKEARLINSTHSRVLFFVVLGLLLLGEFLTLVLADASDLVRDPEIHASLVTMQTFVLLVLIAANSATSVIAEREQGTLDILRVTLVTPADITSGKVLGALRSVLFLALVPVLHLAVAAPFTEVTVGSVVGFTFVLAVLLTFFAVFGTRASIVARKASRAILRAMGLLGFLVIGMPLLCVILMLTSLGESEDFVVFLLFSNPMAVVAFPVDYLAERSGSDSELVAYTVVWVVVYILVAAVSYVLLPAAFRRRIRQDAE